MIPSTPPTYLGSCFHVHFMPPYLPSVSPPAIATCRNPSPGNNAGHPPSPPPANPPPPPSLELSQERGSKRRRGRSPLQTRPIAPASPAPPLRPPTDF
jgi:hypothetical protein